MGNNISDPVVKAATIKQICFDIAKRIKTTSVVSGVSVDTLLKEINNYSKKHP